jgi:hypothetical protein
MYSQKFYLERVRLAKELADLPENAGRRRAYLTLADNWQRMAERAGSATKPPPAQARKQTSSKAWEPMLERALREAGLT